MDIKTRKILDKSFTWAAYASLAVMCLSLAVFLIPIIYNGVGAFAFKATVEHEKFLRETLNSVSSGKDEMLVKAEAARAPLYKMMSDYENPPSAKTIEAKADAYRKASLDLLFANRSRALEAALIDDLEARVEAVKNLSREIWSPYLKGISRLVSESSEDGTSLALLEVLKKHQTENPEVVKAALDNLWAGERLGFSQRNSFRRNFAAAAKNSLEKESDKLEEENAAYASLKKGVRELLGPESEELKGRANLMRQKYGQTRMDRACDVFQKSVLKITVKEKDEAGNEILMRVDSLEYFGGTHVGQMIIYMDENFTAMLQPYRTFYAGFFLDDPYDSNIFGGIWPMIVGTFYLTVGAMAVAAPLGVVAAVYFSEYAGRSAIVSILRMCVGTLAGVPSIVFGLFGLAFLINTLKISEGKSVIAGSITLALLILPTIIRSCEEALKSVPNSYREASLGLGAGKWKSITSVILPSALPGMLTGIIISMGRAAGETAPIIFTAATSTGAALAVWEVFTQPTPALPWNIYNISSEHEMADRVAHVQYGMVLTLVGIVLILNLAAILIRARLRKKLHQ